MKRILSLLLALALCLPLCACGNQKEAEAAQKAKEAYDFLVEAYTKTDEIGDAIYGVWALNVKSAAKIKTAPLGTLLPSTTLSKEELKLGIVCATGEVAAKDQTKDEILSLFRNATEEEMNGVNDIKDEDLGVLFAVVSDMPQFCVLCVQDAYYLNGGVESAQTALESAKAAIKEIEAMNVEPEGMEALKNIYVATSAYLDFCLNVKGSLLQTSDTINEYRTTVKTAMSELDLIY